MNAAVRERIWTWSTRLVPCAGALLFFAIGWESLPPWHSPADRALPIERGGAPLERFAVRQDEGGPASSSADRAATASTDDRPQAETIAVARRPTEQPNDSEETSATATDTSVGESGKLHWLNLRSGVRHNRECRYFDPTGDGRYCGPDEGRACRVCGG